MNVIKFYVKNVYGVQTFYYADDNQQTRAIQAMTGKKTLTPDIAVNLTKLGFTVEQVLAPIKSKGIPATMYHIFDKV